MPTARSQWTTPRGGKEFTPTPPLTEPFSARRRRQIQGAATISRLLSGRCSTKYGCPTARITSLQNTRSHLKTHTYRVQQHNVTICATETFSVINKANPPYPSTGRASDPQGATRQFAARQTLNAQAINIKSILNNTNSLMNRSTLRFPGRSSDPQTTHAKRRAQISDT